MPFSRSAAFPSGFSGKSGALLLALCVAGFLLNAWLLWLKVSDPDHAVIGCGGAGCGSVLGSRWSQIFGIPVTVFGMLAYLAVVVAVWRGWAFLHAVGAFVLSGAVCWFVYIQAAILGLFCLWCMAAHVLGLATAAILWMRLSLRVEFQNIMTRATPCGLVVVLAFALAQIFGPSPASHRLGKTPTEAGNLSQLSIHAEGSGRKVTMARGLKVFHCESLPHLGNPAAPHVLVEYFDYQCAACRTMRGYLEDLMAKHPDKICLIVLPVPLEHACNRQMREDMPAHPGSCVLARLAMVVWRHAPQKFPEVHKAFFQNPAPSDPVARRFVQELLRQVDVDDALRDSWLDALFVANAEDWEKFSAKNNPKLPKLLLNESGILHGFPAQREQFFEVMEKELKL